MKGNQFANELRAAIDACFDGNMANYSRKTKVPSGTLGHYLTSHRHPRVEVLESMIEVLPDTWRAQLILGYLRDMTPSSFRSRVTVTDGKAKKKAGETLVDAMAYLSRYAEVNKEVAKMLEFTAKTFGWKG